MTTAELTLHPLCTLFPRLAGDEFAALVADIHAHGLRQPIVLHDGMVLDGGNRYRACLDAGVEPRFVPFEGVSAVAFVLSANLHRRHLSPGQQAAIVASAQDWAQAQPASRPEKAGNVAGLSTVADRAAQSGASERTQRMADKVAKADPELARQVAHGEMSLPQALARVSPPVAAPAAVPKVAATSAPDLDGGPDGEGVADYGPSADELAEQARQHDADLAAVELVLGSDAPLAAAVAQVRKLTEQVRILQERVNGLTNEAAQAVRLAKHWRSKCEKLERAAA